MRKREAPMRVTAQKNAQEIIQGKVRVCEKMREREREEKKAREEGKTRRTVFHRDFCGEPTSSDDSSSGAETVSEDGSEGDYVEVLGVRKERERKRQIRGNGRVASSWSSQDDAGWGKRGRRNI